MVGVDTLGWRNCDLDPAVGVRDADDPIASLSHQTLAVWVTRIDREIWIEPIVEREGPKRSPRREVHKIGFSSELERCPLPPDAIGCPGGRAPPVPVADGVARVAVSCPPAHEAL